MEDRRSIILSGSIEACLSKFYHPLYSRHITKLIYPQAMCPGHEYRHDCHDGDVLHWERVFGQRRKGQRQLRFRYLSVSFRDQCYEGFLHLANLNRLTKCKLSICGLHYFVISDPFSFIILHFCFVRIWSLLFFQVC